MSRWILSLALAVVLASPAIPIAAQEWEIESPEIVTGVISALDPEERTFEIDGHLYTVPKGVRGFGKLEPGTPVVLRYRQKGDERRVASVRIQPID